MWAGREGESRGSWMSSTTKESLFTQALSMGEGMRQKELERVARKVEKLSERFESMSDEELGGMTAQFRERHERERPSTSCFQRPSPP